MITIYARHCCGCCEAEMHFESEESANAAFSAAGLESSVDIKDDAGELHESVDTFYGWSFKEKELGLDTLINNVMNSLL